MFQPEPRSGSPRQKSLNPSHFGLLNNTTMQQTTAEAPSSLNKANNEINSGIPNLISESVIPINGIIIPRYTG